MKTGFRVGGKLSWLHVTSTEFFDPLQGRGKKRGAMPESMCGIMVSRSLETLFQDGKCPSRFVQRPSSCASSERAREIDGEEWAGLDGAAVTIDA